MHREKFCRKDSGHRERYGADGLGRALLGRIGSTNTKNLKLNIYVALSLVFSLESVFKLDIEKNPLSYDVKLLTLY